MNLKNSKGYVGIDASIAVLILLIIIPTIAGMIYNVNKTNNLIDRKTEAISIAVNAIETAKGIDMADLTKYAVIQELKEKIYINLDTTELTLTKNDNTYKIIINIQDYAETAEGIAKSATSGKVKIATVTVKFRSGKQEKNIELSTVIS